MVLRASCLDLGKKYTDRIFTYCSVFLAFYLIFFVFLMLSFFNVLPYELPGAVYVNGSFDVIIILGIILYMLKTGTQINDHFDIHKGVLLKLKRTLWDAYTNYNGVMERHYATNSSSKIYTEMLKTLKLKNCDQKQYLQEAVSLTDIIMQELDYDKETNPLKLMGLTCSNQLMTSIYTGVASAVFALSQLFYTKYSG